MWRDLFIYLILLGFFFFFLSCIGPAVFTVSELSDARSAEMRPIIGNMV